MLSFPEAVKSAYYACCEKITGWPQNYPDMKVPTDGMVAEDIIENYEGYQNTDVSDPFKHLAWCKQVAEELKRQGLDFVVER